MAASFVYANRSLCLASGGEADVTKWPFFVSPSVWSFPYLADCRHKRAHSQEGHNFPFAILTLGETYIFSLVPLRVAEMTEIFKMIYTNY